MGNWVDNQKISDSKIDLLKCGMSNKQLFNLFGKPYKEIGWEYDENHPMGLGEPTSFIFHYEDKVIYTNGQYFKSMGRVAMQQAIIRDNETNDVIKKIDNCSF